jgi:hypothetical protein
MSDYLLLDSPYAPLDMGMEDDWKPNFERLLPEPKPLGIAFIQNGSLDDDSQLHHQSMVPRLTSFLGSIPHKSDEEAQALIDLLLGPPTVEAARRCK